MQTNAYEFVINEGDNYPLPYGEKWIMCSGCVAPSSFKRKSMFAGRHREYAYLECCDCGERVYFVVKLAGSG